MKYISSIVFILSILAPLQARQRIIGGHETTIEKVPYMAALQHRIIRVYHICGASIISTKHLLTAAHCLPDNNSAVYARVGTAAYNSGGQILRVATFHQHPSYSDLRSDYDFAIVGFESGAEIALGPKVAIIPLPSSSDPEDGSMITVAGWGVTSDQSVDPSVNLREVDLPIVNQQVCRMTYPGIGPTQMCAAGTAEGNINFCLGDSGGPGVQNGVLYGVISGVSWFGCEAPNQPSVLSRVSSVKEWIMNVTGIE